MPTPQNGQTQNGQQPTNCLSLFDHFVGFALKRLNASVCSFNPWAAQKHPSWTGLRFWDQIFFYTTDLHFTNRHLPKYIKMKLNNNKRTIRTRVLKDLTLKQVIIHFCSRAAPLSWGPQSQKSSLLEWKSAISFSLTNCSFFDLPFVCNFWRTYWGTQNC